MNILDYEHFPLFSGALAQVPGVPYPLFAMTLIYMMFSISLLPNALQSLRRRYKSYTSSKVSVGIYLLSSPFYQHMGESGMTAGRDCMITIGEFSNHETSVNVRI